MIDACSKYKECSKQQFCINPDLKESCSYSTRLKNGYNFYNESIRNSYVLQIGNRQFYIGRRSTYGNYSYKLDDEDVEKIRTAIEEIGKLELHKGLDYKLCHNDITSDRNRACCQVIWTIGDKRYNIKNFNVRAVIEDTAKKIRAYLLSKGFSASVEFIGRKTTQSHNAFSVLSESKVSPSKAKKEDTGELDQIIDKLKQRGKAKENTEDTMQVCMFDMITA